jgi:hypothetical protein
VVVVWESINIENAKLTVCCYRIERDTEGKDCALRLQKGSEAYALQLQDRSKWFIRKKEK